MNKTEFVAAIAEEAGISKTDAAKAVKAFTDAVSEELVKGGKAHMGQIVAVYHILTGGVSEQNIKALFEKELGGKFPYPPGHLPVSVLVDTILVAHRAP